jgi:hypothetical protein
MNVLFLAAAMVAADPPPPAAASAEVAALRQEVASLRAELQSRQTTNAPLPSTTLAPAPSPLPIGDPANGARASYIAPAPSYYVPFATTVGGCPGGCPTGGCGAGGCGTCGGSSACDSGGGRHGRHHRRCR